MAQKETAAQRKTRISMLLADYSNRSAELNKLTAIVKGLKAQIDDIPVGTYGEWQRSAGTPREMLNQQEAKRLLTEAGIEVPMSMSKAPIIVSPVAGK